MKALLQRVSEAEVQVEGRTVGKISKGLLVFLCVVKGDTEQDLTYVLNKVVNLRVFEDDAGKMNLSLKDVSGEMLVVSQFTLAARTRKGTRPSFDDAEAPDRARKMYEEFLARARQSGIKTEAGLFGAYMKISLVNDGPVTIMVDSREKRK